MIARPSLGKQIAAKGMKLKPASVAADTDPEMPNFRSRVLRPGGMKKGGAVKKPSFRGKK